MFGVRRSLFGGLAGADCSPATDVARNRRAGIAARSANREPRPGDSAKIAEARFTSSPLKAPISGSGRPPASRRSAKIAPRRMGG